MWIRRKEIQKIMKAVLSPQERILDLNKTIYLGKKVSSGLVEFVVLDVTMKDGCIFLHGGKEIVEYVRMCNDLMRPCKAYSIVINAKQAELCVG